MEEFGDLTTIRTAMAEAVLKDVLKKCGDALLITDSTSEGLKSAISGNLKSKLAELQKELRRLDALLSGAKSLDPVNRHNLNDLLIIWLRYVKLAARFADNLLDDISYDQHRRQVESNKREARLFGASCYPSCAFLYKIGMKIKKFKGMVADLYKEGATIGVGLHVQFVTDSASFQPPADISTDSLVFREDVVVGRESDEDLIVSKLCRRPDNDENLGLIALVGMAGVGKTTLARKIYNNDIVSRIYKWKIWILVSDNFNQKWLLNEMLQSLTGVIHNLSNIDVLENKLRTCLQGESYLLVLDDVWNTNMQLCHSIRNSIVRVTDHGCKCNMLVTTQSYDVASVMDAYYTHRVEPLYDDDAWELFKVIAFAKKTPQQVSELGDIGERILRKCGGLPLAISALASLLATMNEKNQWASVERHALWELPGCKNIMHGLLRSVNHLPNAIKLCFAHCSVVIPKGVSFEEEILIESWIAQGFIQQSETSDDSNMMDIGKMYIKHMLANNLLQSTEHMMFTKKKISIEHMKPKPFTMADIIHDLALYVSLDSCLIIRDSNDLRKASAGVEHVLLINGGITPSSLFNFPCKALMSTLRTLNCRNASISIDLVAESKFLRQLHIIGCGLEEIPNSIRRLKHLQILDLSDNPFKCLPKSIGRLYNLHILRLEQCPRLIDLPQQVTKLRSLRKIVTSEAVHIPKGMGQLTCLTQLPIVKLKAHDDRSDIVELMSLVHLQGELTITQLEKLTSREDAMNAGLKFKRGITDLKLIWTNKRHVEDKIWCSDEELIMEGLQPGTNLEVLRVENFHGERFSAWLSSGLYCINLKRLTLLNCKRCEKLPTLGCLPYLKSLSIDGMESVESIEGDFYYTSNQVNEGARRIIFPSLKEFQLLNMPKLIEWVDPSRERDSAFTCLEELSIKNCPSLVRLPTCFHSLEELTIEGINSSDPLLMILSNSYRLTSLRVEKVVHLTCLSEPLLKCTSLRLLEITGCKELVELPPTLQSLGCLETLVVMDCDRLTSLPDIEGLLSLTTLNISFCENITDAPCGLESCEFVQNLVMTGCPKLSLIPDLGKLSRLRNMCLTNFSEQISIPPWINHFSRLIYIFIGAFNSEVDSFHGTEHLPKCLKSLTLVGWAKLKSLPDELQSLTQLERLSVWRFEGVVALPEWLGNLSSLQILDIQNCKNMKYLPSEDAMRRLTQLIQLRIRGCPVLEERCSKEGGVEWYKISHVPDIFISYLDGEVSTNKTRSTFQEQPGAQKLFWSEYQSDSPLIEIRPASTTSPCENRPFPEKEHSIKHYSAQSPSEHDLITPTRGPDEHSHQELTSILAAVHPADSHAPNLENKDPIECTVSALAAPGQKLFSKVLTTTDMDHRLLWPSEHIPELPDFNGNHQVDFTARDINGRVWEFRCSKRVTGLYNKAVVLAGWVPFIRSLRLKAGDEVIFYRSSNPSTCNFEIRFKRKITLFGANISELLEEEQLLSLGSGGQIWAEHPQEATGEVGGISSTQYSSDTVEQDSSKEEHDSSRQNFESEIQRFVETDESRNKRKEKGGTSSNQVPHTLTIQGNKQIEDEDISMSPPKAKLDKKGGDPVIMEETEEYLSILSLLPKHYEFEEDMLIRLWMAWGHIKDETIGKQRFIRLINQKYLLCSGTNFFTNKGRYHINIEKCQKSKHFQEGQNDTLKWENECNMDEYSTGIQHISLVINGIDKTIFQKLQHFSELRTLLFLANYGPLVKEIPAHFFNSFENLRALDLSGTHIKKLPSSVGHMHHLRYLDLSRTLIQWLPGTICSLKELQTLKLQECSELRELPEELNNLTELRYLDVDVLCQLNTMPKGMKALRNLRTLSAFLVGPQDGYKVDELENLNELTGDFCIARLENVGSANEARNAALDKKRNIKRLELRWTAPEYSWTNNDCDVSVVLESLKPCSVLEELQILCYEGSIFPSWVSSTEFKKLVHVSFYKCEKVSELPPLEQLPSLKYLVLVQMNGVEGFEVQGGSNMVAFPSLEKLKMDEMQSLRTWRLVKTNGDDFKRLSEITINDCPRLRKFDGLPHLSSIKYLEIRECPNLESVSNSDLPQTLDILILENCYVIRKNSISSEDED